MAIEKNGKNSAPPISRRAETPRPIRALTQIRAPSAKSGQRAVNSGSPQRRWKRTNLDQSLSAARISSAMLAQIPMMIGQRQLVTQHLQQKTKEHTVFSGGSSVPMTHCGPVSVQTVLF